MELLFREVAAATALMVEAFVVLILGFAVLQAAWGMIAATWQRREMRDVRREVWMRLALWIVLALEFALAGDIIRTSIAPSWSAVGQLAAIAAIRSALNWLLVRDIKEYDERQERQHGE